MTARCAQVGHSRSLAWLRRELAALDVRHRLEDLDGSAIRLRAARAFTQHVSRFVYECTDENGAAQFHGIHYLSRFGNDLPNVAIFELPTGDDPVSAAAVAPISLDDPALQDAMEHHGLVCSTTRQADRLHRRRVEAPVRPAGCWIRQLEIPAHGAVWDSASPSHACGIGARAAA